MSGAVYTSTVTARGHVLAGVLAAAAVVVGILPRGPWPLAVLTAVALVVTGVHLGTVRLAVRADLVRVGQGPWPGGRRIPVAAVHQVRVACLNRRQAFGVGLPWHVRTTRLTVRRGPALALVLSTGERLWISTADPAVAARLITPSGSTPGALVTMPDRPRQPWFGPKRIGWGLRPQSWQGWAITVAVVLAVIALATWLR